MYFRLSKFPVKYINFIGYTGAFGYGIYLNYNFFKVVKSDYDKQMKKQNNINQVENTGVEYN